MPPPLSGEALAFRNVFLLNGICSSPGGFLADFYCAKAKLVIELDGSQHYTEQGKCRDAERTAILEAYGVQVLRFSNRDIRVHFEGVCMTIHHTVLARMDELADAITEP